MVKCAIYLRKSRADEEAERKCKFNTLNRHKDTLLKIAYRENLSIEKIYEEIVSGENISARPEMIKLLEDVSQKKYDSVLVMDIDRLGRGNMQDQGKILDTFKESNTKIITPRKTYNLNDEFDEEYSEFEAFMARKELKIISRRMQRGRMKSVEEGNYLGPNAPFGYKIECKDKKRYLVIDEETAPIIKKIFEMYSEGIGCANIANELNNMGFKTYTGLKFHNTTIMNIIKNPIYTGKLSWGKRTYKKNDKGNKEYVWMKREDWKLISNTHEAIVSDELYDKCIEQLKRKTHAPSNKKLTNVLAGLMFCKHCGHSMHRRPYTNAEAGIRCDFCNMCKGSRFDWVENDVIEVLEKIVKEYELEPDIVDKEENNINELAKLNIEKELSKLNIQLSSLHDLLEQGIYDVNKFIERQEIINSKIEVLEKQYDDLNKSTKYTTNKLESAKIIKSVIDAYKESDNIQLKNQLLKSIIERIDYEKEKTCKPHEFKLYITLRV